MPKITPWFTTKNTRMVSNVKDNIHLVSFELITNHKRCTCVIHMAHLIVFCGFKVNFQCIIYMFWVQILLIFCNQFNAGQIRYELWFPKCAWIPARCVLSGSRYHTVWSIFVFNLCISTYIQIYQIFPKSQITHFICYPVLFYMLELYLHVTKNYWKTEMKLNQAWANPNNCVYVSNKSFIGGAPTS
jgi:hypothetical protein